MKSDRSYNDILKDIWVRLIPSQQTLLTSDLSLMKQEARKSYLLKVEQGLNKGRKKDIYFIITLCASFILAVLIISLIDYLK